MDTIRIVVGVGTGPTATAAYDDALADAGIHNYNLVTVSSMIPAAADIKIVETAPPLGSPGDKLTIVQARATADPGDEQRITAGLRWATGPEFGVFYEAAGPDPDAIVAELRRGLEDCVDRRNVSLPDRESEIVEASPHPDQYTVALTAGVYGKSRSIQR